MTSDGVRAFEAKRRWLESLLRERLTEDLVLHASPEGWTLGLEGEEGNVLISAQATDFKGAGPACGKWDATIEGLKAPLGRPLPAPGCADGSQPLLATSEHGWSLQYDVLGLAFWMLTRQEELGRTDLDDRGRFPAPASHAFRNGYLQRPIVDEWLDVLGQILVRQWPGLDLKRHRFATNVSHDVDNPSRYAFGGPAALARVMAIDVVRRRDPKAPFKGLVLRARSRRALHEDDPANTFNWIMGQSEARGLTSAFYFVCGRTNPTLDAHYELEDARIRALLGDIQARGHEIGLHPSYNTFQDPAALASEFARLRQVCAREGVEQNEWGSRMHYLRWSTPVTLRALDDAGLDYDNTLTYADAPGFRCGTCFEYSAFDPIENEALDLRIRPLVAMEATVMADRYLGLGDGEEAYLKFTDLKDKCRAVGGTFTLLWHNSYLESDRHKELYCEVLDG